MFTVPVSRFQKVSVAVCDWGPEQIIGRVLGSLDAVSWVRSSSQENFSGRGDFSLGVNMVSDSISPQKLFWMRV